MYDHYNYIFLSNRTEQLYEELKQRLFKETHPLTKRMIIVPSPAMKSWLKIKMAEDPDLGVSVGIEIGFLESTINNLFRQTCTSPQTHSVDLYEPSELELALSLEEAMVSIAETYLSSPQQLSVEWDPLIQYLNITNKLSKRILKRIRALAAVLAKIFLDYGVFGGGMISEWQSNPSCWQALLWQKMESMFASWNYPAKKLGACEVKSRIDLQDVQVHVFGMSFLPPVYYRFLQKLSGHLPVYFYFLSPCQKFWGDTLSDKESNRIRKYWNKQNANQASLEALEEFLRERNPLLANFGRLGREMAMQMESADSHSMGVYALPETVLKISTYSELDSQEIIFEKTSSSLSLLEAVQADLALLRSDGKFTLDSFDSTIQVHAVPKKEREVQVIYDTLISIIEKHQHDDIPILPRDIFVMAPNISGYAPFIRSVFESEDSQLDIQLMDLQPLSQYKIIQGFDHLLSLSQGRWEASALLELFDNASFRKRQNLSGENLLIIKKWIKEAGIYWGNDHFHRDEIMKQHYSDSRLHGQSKVGTWEYGFGRLLEGLAMLNLSESEEVMYCPLEQIEASQGDLLGILIHLIRSLQSDLKPLTNSTQLSLTDWSEYLKCLFEAYFAPNDDEEGVEGAKILKSHIESFGQASKRLPNATFAFETIYMHLQKKIQGGTSSYKESNLHAVRFSSLLPMRAVPAKVVVLMGMSEGQFPGSGQENYLNLLMDHPKGDYCPNRVDFDRYVFLETILSARNYFIISYESQIPGEAQPQSPSLVVKELLSYLDQAFEIEGKHDLIKPSQCCLYHHPLIPFHYAYFTEGNQLRSYSRKYYKAAQIFYHAEKIDRHLFLPNFMPVQNALESLEGATIHIKDLLAFSKNPLKVYLNKVFGIYLDRENEKVVKDDEDLFLSDLNASILIKQGFLGSKDATLKRAEITGKIPLGPFKGISVEKIENEIKKYSEHLKTCEVAVEELFSIEFMDYYQVPKFEDRVWKLPPLEVDSFSHGKVKLIGQIDDVCHKGLFLMQEETQKKVLELWPTCLILNCLIKKYDLPIVPQILFLKAEKIKIRKLDIERAKLPEEILGDYIEYYLSSKEMPSPLLPDLVPSILINDQEKLRNIFKEKPNDDYKRSYDPYINWLKRNSPHAEVETSGDHWQPIAQNLFVDAIHK